MTCLESEQNIIQWMIEYFSYVNYLNQCNWFRHFPRGLYVVEWLFRMMEENLWKKIDFIGRNFNGKFNQFSSFNFKWWMCFGISYWIQFKNHMYMNKYIFQCNHPQWIKLMWSQFPVYKNKYIFLFHYYKNKQEFLFIKDLNFNIFLM